MIIKLECPKALHTELSKKAQKENISLETFAMRILRGVLFINSKIEDKNPSNNIVEYKTNLPVKLLQELHYLSEALGVDESLLAQDGIEDTIGLYKMLPEEDLYNPSDDIEGRYFTTEEVKEHMKLARDQVLKDYVEKNCKEGSEFVLKVLYDFSRGVIDYNEAAEIISKKSR